MSNLFHSLLHKSNTSSNEADNSISSNEDDSYNSIGDMNEKRLSKPEIITTNVISGANEENVEDMIPIYEYKYNNSKISRSITYETISVNDGQRIGISKKHFEINKSSIVTTFKINDVLYSQFTNPKEIQNDRRVRVFILERNLNDDKFIYDINDILSVLSMGNDNEKNVNDFLTGINHFFDDNDYPKIKSKNYWNKLFILVSIIIFILIVICIISYITYTIIVSTFTTMTILSSSSVVVLFILLSLYQINLLRNFHIYSMFNIIYYMMLNYDAHMKYIESWNRSIFFSNRIKVSIPITIGYILFNLDPYQDIQIKHNDNNIMIDKNINTVRETQMSSV